MDHSSRPVKRWRRFGIKTILVLLFFVAIPMAWIARERQQSYSSTVAISKLEKVLDDDSGRAFSFGYFPPSSWSEKQLDWIFNRKKNTMWVRAVPKKIDEERLYLRQLPKLFGISTVKFETKVEPSETEEILALLPEPRDLYVDFTIQDLPLLRKYKQLDRLTGTVCTSEPSSSGAAKIDAEMKALQEAIPGCDVLLVPFYEGDIHLQ